MEEADWQEIAEELMVALAAEAVDIAAKLPGEELDYSEASVEALERSLEAHVQKGAGRFALFKRRLSPGERNHLAQRFGAYLGEVYRRHHGGEWRAEDPRRLKDTIRLHLPGNGVIDPIAQVNRRLASAGSEESTWQYYQQLPR